MTGSLPLSPIHPRAQRPCPDAVGATGRAAALRQVAPKRREGGSSAKTLAALPRRSLAKTQWAAESIRPAERARAVPRFRPPTTVMDCAGKAQRRRRFPPHPNRPITSALWHAKAACSTFCFLGLRFPVSSLRFVSGGGSQRPGADISISPVSPFTLQHFNTPPPNRKS